ncbi:Lactonase, 7-bladed beta-propeller-domain-containing protein [Ephemerocybe angulata]|uniref:Lactonase, 7-bladed beta-propeller-domain-containing protein n=1 Tax=Ephemerocybe angulata TaxID=980116 RepID=A0A8H6IA15_9AGAR|nr:Lactonase, 7-bladed beta-propeller-domain-containing protein [Tulosesus angulatus]
MVNFTILAGGFTTFIATYVFDSEAGSLSLTKQNPTGENPSWIASHPLNKTVLYAVNEIGPVGNLQSFLIDDNGFLSLVDTAATGGNGPTYTEALSTGEVSGMNFGSPNASFIATNPEDPARFVQSASPVVSFPVGDGPSNPHMSLEFNGEVFVPDLGADKIWRLKNDGGEPGNFKVQGQIDITPGNGPRHIAIRDNLLFILHEKTSVLTAQPIPSAPNGTTLPVLANVSIVPEEAKSLNGSFFAAELVISEPSEAFPDPLIYVSNRNLGPDFDARGDSIAIFEYSALLPGGNGTQTDTNTDTTTDTTTGTESTPAGTDGAEQPTITVTATSTLSSAPTATQTIKIAPTAFTTLVAANTPAKARRESADAEPVAKRMVKYHARRRAEHEQYHNHKRQDYGYGSGDSSSASPASSSSASAPASSSTAAGASTITLVSGSTTPASPSGTATATATGTTATSGGPIVATATPTAATLRLTNQVFTGLRQIRSFAIGKTEGGGDEFLIAGANLDGGVAVFKRTEGGRNLELVVRNEELQNRTSFVFL